MCVLGVEGVVVGLGGEVLHGEADHLLQINTEDSLLHLLGDSNLLENYLLDVARALSNKPLQGLLKLMAVFHVL